MGFQMSEIEFDTFLFCSPPPIWGIVPNFPVFNYEASPKKRDWAGKGKIGEILQNDQDAQEETVKGTYILNK